MLFLSGAAASAAAPTDSAVAAAAGVPAAPPPSSPPSSPPSPPDSLRGRAILTVGGRSQVVHHLRSAAGRFQAEIVHHDGGLESSLRTLAALVERCDLVCRPIDGISHDACRRAKQLCKRLNKPFIPLRSSGAAGFFQVLRTVGRGEWGSG